MDSHLPQLDLIDLNRLAQNNEPLEPALDWFRGMGVPEQRLVLTTLVSLAVQAGAHMPDVEPALARAGLRPGHTQAVLLTKPPLNRALWRVASLRESEHERSFRALMSVFLIADERRRLTRCKGACSHWWHRDLSDPAVRAALMVSTE